MLLLSETNRLSADSTTILCEWWLTASCRRYNWIDKSTVSLAVHNADAILETITVLTHGKLHYEILIVYKRDSISGFLHHVLTVNQRLTNRALNNVLNRPFYSCVLSCLAMNASEAGGDLALIQTSLLFSCKCKLVSIRTT